MIGILETIPCSLTRIAAIALIGLAVLLALVAFMIGRKPAAPQSRRWPQRGAGNHRRGSRGTPARGRADQRQRPAPGPAHHAGRRRRHQHRRRGRQSAGAGHRRRQPDQQQRVGTGLRCNCGRAKPWHACPRASRSAPTACAWPSAPRRSPAPPPASPPWSAKCRCRTSPKAARSAAARWHRASLQLRPGERALAVPVDELVGAGNRILPGDFVDVFLNLRNAQPSVNGPGEAGQTRLLLSRLRVLSYGQQDIAPVATEVSTGSDVDTRNDPRAADITGSGSSHANNTEPAQPARSAVLAVPVADANRLLLGAQQGKLFLALRNPADTGQPDLALFPQSRGVIDPARAGCGTAAGASAPGKPCLRRHRQRCAGRPWHGAGAHRPRRTGPGAGATPQRRARPASRSSAATAPRLAAPSDLHRVHP